MKQKILGGLSIKELAKKIWREANEDNIFGRAAELAYYFLLALFPMLIFLTSLVAFLPGAQEGILDAIAKVAPSDAMRLVRETLHDIVSNRSGGLLSFGVLGTIWAASSGTTAVMEALNDAYEAEEGRGFIKLRGLALGMTVALALLIVGGTTLIMFGDRFALWIADAAGLGPTFATVWHYVDYLIGLALIFVGLQVIYYFGPNIKQDWKWITPGAMVAVAALIIVSLLFSVYLRVAPSYSATYGSLGAVIILMLYLYLIGLVILLGAEINSEINKANHVPVIEKEPSNDLKAA
ncbi:MAG TPA: YihY/virulence factor BrkB family protein [Blastocatellia bacterium]|jgi:membrane protein|nr:YihY/virulence factor BrkB family protein [Blastocatellia bacterium]